MTHHRFPSLDYERLIALGILAEHDHVELIAGEIIKMPPVSNRHVQIVNLLGHLLYAAIGDSMIVSIQHPVHLGEYDEPRPDLALLRGVGRGRVDAADVRLVVEVADGSQVYDRRIKLSCYAKAGVPEAWLVDTAAEAVTRYTEPHRGYYRFASLAMHGDTFASTIIPVLTIPVDLVLGEAEE